MRLALGFASIAMFVAAATPNAHAQPPCPFFFCMEKRTPPAPANFQTLVAGSDIRNYSSIKDLYYVDLKINCNATGLINFAKRYVEQARNIGLAHQDRDFALTVDIEKIMGGNQAAVAIATYPIVQVKKDAAGNTVVSACDDFIATNLPFDANLRLKFKLLQSKQTRISDATYAGFRLVARLVGFVAGTGPQGLALAAAASNISTKVSESRSDIDQIASSFDELNTSKPQIALGKTARSIKMTVDDGSSFTIERIGKRSVFMEFSGDAVQNASAAFDTIIEQNTALNLTSYLDQKAPAWKSLLPSTDAQNAVQGCTNLRNALRVVFTEEERAVLLARLISDFGETTIKNLKEPCLHPPARAQLKVFGITAPLPVAGTPETLPTETARPADRDNTDRLRWSAIERFLDEYGRVVAGLVSASADDRAKKLKAYFDERVVTESFDSPDLLPTSNGAQRDSLAKKLASWPYGAKIRYGCFMRPPKLLAEKYSGQMLIELDSGGTAPKLINMVVGFTDRETTEVDKLVIGNMIVEIAMTGALEEIKKTFADGCGDRADRWKPWEGRAAVARGGLVDLAALR